MDGRAEVWRLSQRLEATIKRIGLTQSDPELQSDFAKYLCVLVSGYVETAVTELLLEHSRRQSAPSIQRFVEFQTRRITNLNAERLQQLLGSFDPDWRTNISQLLIDEKKDALDSVVSLRNRIAHGDSVGITYQRIIGYFSHIKPIVERVADLCAPQR